MQRIGSGLDALNFGTGGGGGGSGNWNDLTNVPEAITNYVDSGIVDIQKMLASSAAGITLGAGDNNDIDPLFLQSSLLLRVDVSDATSAITGITAPTTPVNSGAFKYLLNTTANSISIDHQDTASSAANRIICPNGDSFILGPGAGVWMFYETSATRWYIAP